MSPASRVAVVAVVIVGAVISQAGLGQAQGSKADKSNGGVLSEQEPRFKRSSLIGSSSGGRPLVEDLKKRSAFSSLSSLSATSDGRKLSARSLEDVSAVSRDFLTPTGSDVSGSVLHRMLRRAASQGQGQVWAGSQDWRPRRSLRPWSLYALTPYAAKQPSYALPRVSGRHYGGWQGTSWGRGFYAPASASFQGGRGAWGQGEGSVAEDDAGTPAWQEDDYQQPPPPQQPSPGSSRRFMAWGRHGSFMLG